MTGRLLLPAGMLLAFAGMVWLNLSWSEAELDLSPIALSTAPVANAEGSGAGSASSAASANPPTEVSESLSRPLFHASRRPFVRPPPEPTSQPAVEPPVAAVEPAPPPALPELRLAGLSSAGERKSALLGRADAPDLQWVQLGDSIAGWRIDAITASSVVLVSGDQRFTMALYPDHQPESAVP